MKHRPFCPCGHLDDANCIRHNPITETLCTPHGYACRSLGLDELRRHRDCPYCTRKDDL